MKALLKILSVIIFIIGFFAAQLQAAPYGKIYGIITNQTTNEPIPDANIIIEKTDFGTASKDNGLYYIKNLPVGFYDVTVKVIGYNTKTIANVRISKDTELNIALKPGAVQLNPIIVTATGYKHLKSNVTVASEIMSRKELLNNSSITPAEIVNHATGIHLHDYGGYAGIKSPAIRGSNSEQVLILLDGQRLNSSQNGNFDLNSIPLESLEKIEIIRGGHSAFYGTDAIGGIINLVTREFIKQKKPSVGIKTTTGSFGTRGYNFFGSQKIGGFDYLITYDHLQSQGNFKYTNPYTGSEEIRKNNDYDRDNLLLKAGYTINKKSNIVITHRLIQSERGSAGSLQYLSNKARNNIKDKLTNLHLSYQLIPQLKINNFLYLHNNDNIFKDPEAYTPVISHHENKAYGFKGRVKWDPRKGFSLNTGFEYRKENLESSDIGKRNRTNIGTFFHGEIDFPLFIFDIKIVPAIRYDKYTSIGSIWSPKFGILLNCKKIDNLFFRSNTGKSFRAPTFNDLWWPEDSWTRGNPDLKPETSLNFDCGFSYHNSGPAQINIESTYFNRQIKNLILWQPDINFIYSPDNIGRANIKGIENTISLRLLDYESYLKISHTYINAVNKTKDSDYYDNTLIYRPNNKISFSTGCSFKSISILIDYTLVGKQYSDKANDNTISKYQLLNSSLSYSLEIYDFNINFNLKAKNLLNENYILMKDYPLPGREILFLVGFEY
ncbi:MAG: TonB-dependent receptor [bacterium]